MAIGDKMNERIMVGTTDASRFVNGVPVFDSADNMAEHYARIESVDSEDNRSADSADNMITIVFKIRYDHDLFIALTAGKNYVVEYSGTKYRVIRASPIDKVAMRLHCGVQMTGGDDAN